MTKEGIANAIISKNRKGSYEDWVKNICDGLEEYASRQPFQQLISWMEKRIGLFNDDLPVSQRHAYDAYLNCIKKAKELAATPQGTRCTCKESLGHTTVACCNDCGLPVEKWWNGAPKEAEKKGED